eukprot:COSAG01_NODE_310_length_19129_cov_22.110615_10_plen_239_part_00
MLPVPRILQALGPIAATPAQATTHCCCAALLLRTGREQPPRRRAAMDIHAQMFGKAPPTARQKKAAEKARERAQVMERLAAVGVSAQPPRRDFVRGTRARVLAQQPAARRAPPTPTGRGGETPTPQTLAAASPGSRQDEQGGQEEEEEELAKMRAWWAERNRLKKLQSRQQRGSDDSDTDTDVASVLSTGDDSKYTSITETSRVRRGSDYTYATVTSQAGGESEYTYDTVTSQAGGEE